MEDGTVTLVGATTENPSFELNAALLSRARVLVFQSLGEEASKGCSTAPRQIEGNEAAARRRGADDAGAHRRRRRPRRAHARRGSLARRKPGEVFDAAALLGVVQRRAPIYDKSQDGHYNLISALHKSVRGSDPDAALYYLARMLDAGEEPLYLGRRLVRMAMEDIGLADPQALVVANAAKDAYDISARRKANWPSPRRRLSRHGAEIERRLHGLQGSDRGRQGARLADAAEGHPQRADQADEGGGLGSGYHYDHDKPDAFSGQDYFPEKIGRQRFYDPPDRGFEREIRKRLDYWAKLRKERGRGVGNRRTVLFSRTAGAGIRARRKA